MTKRERIADAGNTLVPAVLALRAAGFTVSREPRSDGEWWRAETDELELIAADPLTLLGLAAMRRNRGADWKATDAEIDAVIREYGLDTDAT